MKLEKFSGGSLLTFAKRAFIIADNPILYASLGTGRGIKGIRDRAVGIPIYVG